MGYRSLGRAALGGATVLAALATVLVTGGIAQAAPAFQYDFNTAGVRIHANSETGPVAGLGYPGDGFAPENCQGTYDLGTDIRTGVTGYVYYAYITGDC